MPDDLTQRWSADRPASLDRGIGDAPLPLPVALGRGLLGRCPRCGQGRIFAGFLKVVPTCACCAAPLGRARADDAPPYFVIIITGHLVVPSMLMVQRAYDPSSLVQAAIWLPIAATLALGLLRPVKGATVGLMLKLGMMKEPGDA